MVRLTRLPVIASVAMVLLIVLLIHPVSALDPWSMVGTAVWVQVQDSDGDGWAISETSTGTLTYASVNFDPSGCKQPCLTLAGITQLSADFMGPTGGGAPRFSIAIDVDGDGIYTSSDPNIFVYFGPAPSFVSDLPGWQSTGNLIGASDGRWDTSQIQPGGHSGDTYQQALDLVGLKCVLDFELVVDAGWANPSGVQKVLVDNIRINGGSCESLLTKAPPAHLPVGGIVVPTNNLKLLTPYLALAGLVIAVSAVVVVKRKRD